MANSYFQFKHFTVNQEKAAMKVCTDACLFGAWVADTINSTQPNTESILDIGTGTGLLALMLAQKTTANIHAVELNESAAQQAKQNFDQSKYKNRLKLLQGDIRDLQLPVIYDLIISNPPFYKNDLKSADEGRNTALHSTALDFDELILSVKNVLSRHGLFAVLVPSSRSENFILTAEKQGFNLRSIVQVSQTQKHSYFRSMLLFSFDSIPIERLAITINIEGNYSDEFIRLLQDYYLYL